jgi:hypothetical protein
VSPGAPPPPDPALARRVDAWIAGAVERAAPLTLRDVRKGVQSVSAVYVEDRSRGALAARAEGGPARRAALATYYAPLHFLTARHAAGEHAAALGDVDEILDLGCGTGAAGAGAAVALGADARVLGIDRSGWALGEARHTYAAFGLRARTRRAPLPGALPALGRGRLVVMGWMANELVPEAREALVERLERGLARGARLLWLEPLSGRVSPWWDAMATRLTRLGVMAAWSRTRPERPDWVARLDAASGLDHREIGARVLAGPA